MLDLNMPEEDGLSIVRASSKATDVPIIMLTATASPIDRVVGLELGADDYLAKPCELRELAGAHPLGIAPGDVDDGAPPVRRASRASKPIRFGTKWLDVEAQVLRDENGNEHPLASSEFALLKAFAENPKRVLSRERLLDLAEARDREAFDRAIDVRITRIRREDRTRSGAPFRHPHGARRRLSCFRPTAASRVNPFANSFLAGLQVCKKSVRDNSILKEQKMPISQKLRALIDNAWTDGYPCLIATNGPEGPNISPKGSMLVFDDEHLAYWERSKKQVLANLSNDKRVCVIYPNFKAQRNGVLESGFLRFYGTAELHEAGPLREAIFKRLSKREQEHDGADKGIGVLIKISRAADVRGKPLPS